MPSVMRDIGVSAKLTLVSQGGSEMAPSRSAQNHFPMDGFPWFVGPQPV